MGQKQFFSDTWNQWIWNQHGISGGKGAGCRRSRCCDDCALRIYYEERAKATCRKGCGCSWLYVSVCVYLYIYVYIHMLYRLQDLVFFASRIYAGSSLIFFVCVFGRRAKDVPWTSLQKLWHCRS